MALTVTPGDTALKPLAPVHVAAVRAGDGIHISWIRRTRIDGDGWGVEVPLGEESEAYALEILSGGAVVRTIACTSPQALYAAADELADFGAVQTSLHIRVAQISAPSARDTRRRSRSRFERNDCYDDARQLALLVLKGVFSSGRRMGTPQAFVHDGACVLHGSGEGLKCLDMQLELLTFRFRQFR